MSLTNTTCLFEASKALDKPSLEEFRFWPPSTAIASKHRNSTNWVQPRSKPNFLSNTKVGTTRFFEAWNGLQRFFFQFLCFFSCIRVWVTLAVFEDAQPTTLDPSDFYWTRGYSATKQARQLFLALRQVYLRPCGRWSAADIEALLLTAAALSKLSRPTRTWDAGLKTAWLKKFFIHC